MSAIKTIMATAIIASTALLSGCVTPVADMTLASTKNVNVTAKVPHDYHKGNHVQADDKVGMFIIPFGQPSVKKVMDKAIALGGNCAVGLTDVRVSQLWYGFGAIGAMGYKVEGDLLLDNAAPDCSADPTKSELPPLAAK